MMEIHKGNGRRPTTVQVELTDAEVAVIGHCMHIIKVVLQDMTRPESTMLDKPELILAAVPLVTSLDVYNGIADKMLKVVIGLEEAKNL